MNVLLRLLGGVGLILLSICLFTSAYADGISVSKDLKQVQEEHITIKLSDKQKNEVERTRFVYLTDKQLIPLKNIYNKAPKKISVLSSRYDSCTCGMGIYAIWCRAGEIDIPISSIKSQKWIDQNKDKNSDALDEEDDTSEGNSYFEIIIFDSNGRMFHKGNIINESEACKLIDWLSVLKSKDSNNVSSLVLDTPPPISLEIDKKIFNISSRLEKYSKSKGIDFSAQGLKID